MSDRSYIDAIDHETACTLSNRASELAAPFVIYGARVFRDGNQWCALLGDDLMTGVVGFGASPNEATIAFDKAWYEKVSPTDD